MLNLLTGPFLANRVERGLNVASDESLVLSVYRMPTVIPYL